MSMSRDYSKGKIYLIKNNVNDLVYVGSTTLPLGRRFKQHKDDSRKLDKQHWKLYEAFTSLGVQNFCIELIEKYPCESMSELLQREGFFIRTMNSIEKGYNKTLSGRTIQEYKQDNKDRILERDRRSAREYYRKNTDAVLQHNKEYRSRPDVQQRIQAYAKEYSITHKQEKQEYNKLYKELKGDVIRARAGELITCEHCNKQVRRDHRKKHTMRCTKSIVASSIEHTS